MRDVSILTDNGVDLESSLELLGDLEFYDETVESFLEEQKTRLDKLKEYLDNLDMENYAILVHAMKSDSKYLGLKKLAELSLEHEIASKANNIDLVKSKFDELMKEAKRTEELLIKYMGE
jgi:HPt (histidine-containing phosphotransfer) domain-containing protein